jgi:hypothetical protein
MNELQKPVKPEDNKYQPQQITSDDGSDLHAWPPG